MRPRFRRLLAGVVFGAIVFCGIDTRFVRMLFPSRGEVSVAGSAGAAARSYERFLGAIARNTVPGQSVAIAVQAPWSGYAYPFYRASYILAGRRVIPLVDPDGSVHVDRADGADFVAAWRMEAPDLVLVLREGEGSLYRVKR